MEQEIRIFVCACTLGKVAHDTPQSVAWKNLGQGWDPLCEGAKTPNGRRGCLRFLVHGFILAKPTARVTGEVAQCNLCPGSDLVMLLAERPDVKSHGERAQGPLLARSKAAAIAALF